VDRWDQLNCCKVSRRCCTGVLKRGLGEVDMAGRRLPGGKRQPFIRFMLCSMRRSEGPNEGRELRRLDAFALR
jgi:hypothetical protein